MSITVRPAIREDAEIINRLGNEFDDYLRTIGDPDPTPFDLPALLRDGFGSEPAFFSLVAEIDSEVIGYLFYHPGYDLDRGGRVLYIVDLFVTEGCRGKGAGRALMKEAADICVKMGGKELVWAVFIPNKLAAGFYEHIGGRYLQQNDMTYMHLRINGEL